jgi:hypothetical protein
MTPNTSKSLSDIFDVELTNTDKSISELKITATTESIDSLEKQRDYVKKNIIALIEKGSLALDEMMEISKSTESGKDYKVVIEMVKTLVDTNTQLFDIEVAHKPKDLTKEEIDGVKTLTQNNTTVFVGSTTDLSRHLKSLNDSSIIENKQ